MNEPPTPRTDAAEIIQTFAGLPPVSTRRVSVDFARQLERELAAELEKNEANRKAVELLDKWLAAERELADRLAAWLDTVLAGYDDAKEIAPFDHTEAHAANRAIKAWKEARRGTY